MLKSILTSFIAPVLSRVLGAAQSRPDVIMGMLENWNPDTKKRLQTNQLWQALKGKSPREIEEYAANLIKNPQFVSEVLGTVDPGLARRVQNSPIYQNLRDKNPDEIGRILTNLAGSAGLLRRQ